MIIKPRPLAERLLDSRGRRFSDPRSHFSRIHRQRGFIINPFAFGVAATDPLFSYVKLLLHGEGVPTGGTITDEIGKTIFNSSSTTTETVAARFGATGIQVGGGYFGTNHHADFVLGTLDWCLEFFIYFTSVSGTQAIAAKQTGTGVYPFNLALNVTPGKLTFRGFNASVALDYSITGSTTVASGQWYHVALVHNAGTFTLGLDGASDGTVSPTLASRYNDVSDPVWFCSTGAPSLPMNGYIDEVRFTIGHARYTSFPYVVPIAQFPDA